MAKLTIEELHALREREAAEIKKRDIHGRTKHVVVAMGTTGLEAGAKLILNEFSDVVESRDLDDVIITQCGAIEGAAEPAVEIHTPELGLLCYGAVEKDDVAAIVEDVLVRGVARSEKRIEVCGE